MLCRASSFAGHGLRVHHEMDEADLHVGVPGGVHGLLLLQGGRLARAVHGRLSRRGATRPGALSTRTGERSRAEVAVAEVAQPGQDELALVQAAVEHGGVDRRLRESAVQRAAPPPAPRRRSPGARARRRRRRRSPAWPAPSPRWPASAPGSSPGCPARSRGQLLVVAPGDGRRSSRSRPTKPTRASGKREPTVSSMASPERSTGTSTTCSARRCTGAGSSGVCTVSGRRARSRVASKQSSWVSSRAWRRKSATPVRTSRRWARQSSIRGWATTTMRPWRPRPGDLALAHHSLITPWGPRWRTGSRSAPRPRAARGPRTGSTPSPRSTACTSPGLRRWCCGSGRGRARPPPRRDAEDLPPLPVAAGVGHRPGHGDVEQQLDLVPGAGSSGTAGSGRRRR